MLERFASVIRSGRATRVLLALFCLLAAAVVLAGLHHVTGYVLGYLATAVLFVLFTRNWRSVRVFLILLAASVLGIFFLSFFYVEVLSRLAVAVGGIEALDGMPLRVMELIITYIIIFVCVDGMFFGIAGAAVLGGVRISAQRSRGGSVAE